eukprot:CAMPEP_0171311496 /NCGR_PEP_ID=MMETSP0816-20121228/21760_1 /TAXON_ID=420281 /ORGANISM="Proboscia inermis, Strain CCAP1064/1" /LENGTH=111 /DNA_ID=CAMNT_0011796309 /DNA_START=61 /DNA_END=396 /DNA_ORIENTATION=+
MAKIDYETTGGGGIKGFLGRANKSFYSGGLFIKDWGLWAAKKSARVGFVIATTSIVVLMPLIFELAREGQSLEVERAHSKDLKSQGYSERQLQELGFSEFAIRPPSVALKK